MGKTCSMVYLDKDLTGTTIYDTYLKNNPPELAKQLYILHMRGLANTEYKLDKGDFDIAMDKLIKENDDLIPAGNDDFYDLLGSKRERATTVTSNLKKEAFDEVKIVNNMTVRNKAKEIQSKAKLKDAEYIIPFAEAYKQAMEYYEIKGTPDNPKGFTSDNDEWSKDSTRVAARFKFQTENGTAIHDMMEEVFQKYAILSEEERTDDAVIKLCNDIAEDRFSEHENMMEYGTLAQLVFKSVKESGIPGDISKWKIFPEFRIQDEKLNIAGTIDLMIQDESGTLHVLDYKTKMAGKEDAWDSRYKTKNIPGHTVYDNKESDAAIQTGIYVEMLRLKGFTVSTPKVIYIAGKITPVKGKFNEFTYGSFHQEGSVMVKALPSYRNAIQAIFNMRPNSVDLDEAWRLDKEDGKLSSIDDMIKHFTGGEEISGTMSTDNIVKGILRGKEVKDKKTGKPGFIDPTSNQVITYTSEDETKRAEQIKNEYDKMYKEKDALVQQAFDLFKGSTVRSRFKGRSELIQRLSYALEGVTKETHSLVKMNEVPGMGDMPNNYLLAIDNLTNEHKVIIVTNEFNKGINFGRAQNSKTTTVFGKFYEDAYAKNLYSNDCLKSNYEGFNVMQAGMALMRLKSMNPDVTVGSIRYAEALPGDDRSYRAPRVYGMELVLPQISNLIKESKKSSSHIPLSKGMEKVFDDASLNDFTNYTTDSLNTVRELIDGAPIHNIQGLINSIKADLDARAAGIHWNNDILRRLCEYQRQVQKIMKDKGLDTYEKFVTYEDKSYGKMYVALSHAILGLQDITKTVTSSDLSVRVDAGYSAYGKIDNVYIQELNAKRTHAELKASEEFWNYKKELDKKLKAYKKDHKSRMVNAVSITRSDTELYHPLFINGGKPDTQDNYKTSMKLKSPADLRAEGDESGAQLVEFFNKSTKEFFEKSFFIQDDVSKFSSKNGFSTEEGYIPLFGASQETLFSNAKTPRDKLKVIKDGFNRNLKIEGDDVEVITDFLDNEDFIRQGTEKGRLDIMGFNSEGQKTKSVVFETNLEEVLDKFVLANLAQKHLNESLGLYRAMQGALAAYSVNNKADVTKVSNLLTGLVDNTILNTVAAEKFGPFVDKMNALATWTQLALSPKQMLVEITTNMVASTNTMLSQQLISWFGSGAKFTAKDWTKAGRILIGDTFKKDAKVVPIMEQLGIMHGDLTQLQSDELKQTIGQSLFTSKYAFYINAKALHGFRNQIFVSEMIKDGVYDAYEYDEKADESVYNQKKDKRFFSEDGGQTERQKLRLEAEKNLALEDGTLDGDDSMPIEDRNLTRPYSYQEIASKKDWYKDIFGAMDKTGKTDIQKSAIARMLLKFKYWGLAKKDFYYTPTHTSKIRKEWKESTDEEGNVNKVELVDAEIEGAIQTYAKLFQKVKIAIDNARESDPTKKVEPIKLSERQQENIAKSATDLITSTLLIAAISQLLSADDDDSWWKTEKGKLIKNGLRMGVEDSNVVLSMTSLAGSGGFAQFGIATRFLKNIYNLGIGIIQMDMTQTGEAGNRLVDCFGIGRAATAVVSDIKED